MIVEFEDKRLQSTLQNRAKAYRFASETLIPSPLTEEINPSASILDMEEQAEQLGVHPSVIIGRLQHDKQLSYPLGNKRYKELLPYVD
jgi:hypothetical protein